MARVMEQERGLCFPLGFWMEHRMEMQTLSVTRKASERVIECWKVL